MAKTLLYFCLGVSVLLSEGCALWEGGLPEHVLARIDQEEITVEDFQREFKELVTDLRQGEDPAGLKNLKEAFLEQMIERKLLAQEARRLGIQVSTEELNQVILEIKKDYPGEGFGETLGLRGMSLEEWKQRLEEKLLAEKLARNHRPYAQKIDEKEIQKFYETHRSLFRLPRKVRARQIVVADGNEALELQKRLRKGERFEKLAQEKSIGPERIRGGDLGYFSKGERPAEFDHIFTMEVGTISEVIKSPYGYHIFKLEEVVESKELSYEEAKHAILQRLEQEKGEEEYQTWLKQLKEKATIKINKKWLRS